jgi:predicted tellurium resistance membrane protein TerC
MPISYLAKVIVSVIGTGLFTNVMPDNIKGIPDWVFYSIFAWSFLAGFVVTTALFKAVVLASGSPQQNALAAPARPDRTR